VNIVPRKVPIMLMGNQSQPMIAIAAMVDKLMNSRIDGGGILLRSLCV